MPPSPSQPSKRRRPNPPSTTPSTTPARPPPRPVSALTKPFKSPLHRPPSTPSQASRPTPHALAQVRATESDIAALEQALRLLNIPDPAARTTSTPAAVPDVHAHTDAHGTPVPRADAALEARTRAWRRVGRAAAEAVHEDMGARIADAGGLRAWRAREREREREHGGAWGADEGDRDGDERAFESLSVLERREVRRLREEAREQLAGEKGQEEGCKTKDDQDDDAEFTLGAMLRMLYVDHSLLGWMEQEQRWSDD